MQREKTRLISVKLFSNDCNLCDYSTSTSQRDRQTDGRTDDLPWQYSALRIQKLTKKEINKKYQLVFDENIEIF